MDNAADPGDPESWEDQYAETVHGFRLYKQALQDIVALCDVPLGDCTVKEHQIARDALGQTL